MCKYIDYEETKRLSRLRNVRGSISLLQQHNSWQALQLQKRRSEQIRQRKKDENAKKKDEEKKGFQVDTGSTATPYEFTKCGLKLNLSSQANRRGADVVKEEMSQPESSKQPLMSRFARDSIELNRRKNAPSEKKIASLKDGGTNEKNKQAKKDVKPIVVRNKNSNEPISDGETNNAGRSNSSRSEGKENDEANQNQTCGNAVEQPLIEGKLLLKRKKTRKKSTALYFMDFESLKREHADAILMLKQLDEENKRLFVTEHEENVDEEIANWANEDNEVRIDESIVADVILPDGLMHATHLSISLHDLEDNPLQQHVNNGDDDDDDDEMMTTMR